MSHFGQLILTKSQYKFMVSRFICSVMLCRVVWHIISRVSENLVASFFMTEDYFYSSALKMEVSRFSESLIKFCQTPTLLS